MTRCTISNDWAYRGIPSTVLENGDLRVLILTGKGADVSEIVYKPLTLNLLFRNPWGPRSPKLFPTVSPHNEMFRDFTGGGWSDILPNAGDPCDFGGAHFGLHDETPLLEWSSEITERTDERVSAMLSVRLKKYPFSVRKLVSLDSLNNLTITETVENESKQDLPFSWLIHPTFSTEFAEPGTVLEFDGSRMFLAGDGAEKPLGFPLFTDRDGANRDVRVVPPADFITNDTLVVDGLKEGRYSIVNKRLGIRFTLTWDKAIFPYIWYYRSLGGKDYPYYGRSRFVALEPSSSKSGGLAAQVAASDALTLGAGKTLTTTMTANVGTP